MRTLLMWALLATPLAAQELAVIELVSEPAGDMNGDGWINFQDLGPFGMALVEPEAYDEMYPGLDREALCDVSGDNLCNFGDLGPFGDELLKPHPVPAPPASILYALGVVTLAMFWGAFQSRKE